MMGEHKKGSGASGSNLNYSNELKAVRAYLTKHIATATMTALALNIYRPNLCRHKAALEKAGQLKIVKKRGICKATGFHADYLSCNLDTIGRGTDEL